MLNKRNNILCSYWFILALVLLLVNDFLLKKTFGNWFTGKLSDFAGLFVFVIFWTVAFPKYKRIVFTVTALLFSIWKSPISDPLIEGWNSLRVLTIERVVDLSDLIALFILPIAYRIENRATDLHQIRLNPALPFVISAFAFGATSYSSNEHFNKTYTLNVSKDSIVNKLDQLDSVSVLNKSHTADTINLVVKDNICIDGYTTNIIVTELSDSSSKLVFVASNHSCPKNEVDKQDILKSFEKLVIDRLN